MTRRKRALGEEEAAGARKRRSDKANEKTWGVEGRMEEAGCVRAYMR